MRCAAVAAAASILFLSACGGDLDEPPPDMPAGADTEPDTEDDVLDVVVDDDYPAAGTDDDAYPLGSFDDVDVDPCALLTSSEVAAVLGDAPEPDRADGSTRFSACSWASEDATTVVASVLLFGDAVEAEAEFDAVVARNDYLVVYGLGDRAYDTTPGTRVTAQWDRYEVSLSVDAPDVTDEQIYDLVALAIDRLP